LAAGAIDSTVNFFPALMSFGLFGKRDGGHDVFVHVTAVQRAGLGKLPEGTGVTFDLILNHHGKPVADNLKMK
jgi:CspA family cold shock protein